MAISIMVAMGTSFNILGQKLIYKPGTTDRDEAHTTNGKIEIWDINSIINPTHKIVLAPKIGSNAINMRCLQRGD